MDSAEELGVEEGDGEKEEMVAAEEEEDGEEEDGEGEAGDVDRGGEAQREVACQEMSVIPKEGQETFQEVKKILNYC